MPDEESKGFDHLEPEPYGMGPHEARRWAPIVIIAVLVLAGALVLLLGGPILQNKNVRFLKQKEKAASFFSEGEFAKALAAYGRALALKPDEPDIRESIAKCHLQNGDLPEAIAAYHRCLQGKPEDTEITLTLASLYLLAKNIDRAKEIVHSILEREPDNMRALAMDAQCYYEQNENRRAVVSVNMITGILPATASPYNLPSGAEGVVSDPEETEKKLLQAVEADPNKVQPHKNLADFYRRQKRFGDAEKEYKKMTEIASTDPYVWLHLADFYRGDGVGRLADAIEQYSHILDRIESRNLFALRGIAGLSVATADLESAGEADPESAKKLESAEKYVERLLWEQRSDLFGLFYRGILELYEKKMPPAEKDLGDAAKDRSEYGPVHYLLGYVRLVNHALPQAKKSLEQAIKVEPTFDRPRLLLAEIELNLGQYEKVLEVLDKLVAIESEKDNPLAHLLRARVYITQNDPSQAEAPLTKLADVDKTSIFPRLLVAEVYKRIGKSEEAVSQYQAAVKAHPDSALASYLLGLLYEKMGEPVFSMINYEDAIKKSPNFAVAARELAIAYVRNAGDEKADAKAVGKRFLDSFPGNYALLDILGRVFYERREFSKAVEVFELIPQQERESRPQVICHYALALYQSGRSAQARKELQKAARWFGQARKEFQKAVHWLRDLPTPADMEKTLDEINSAAGIVG